MNVPDFPDSLKMNEHAAILLDSYERHFNQKLLEIEAMNENIIEQLWNADFVLISHGTEADPIFNFGNRLALDLFEMDFESFTRLPSRKSAERISQEERDALLAEVTRNGCIDNYSGVRISSSGRKFYIENARVWNLIDSNSQYCGQAAMFKTWRYLK